MEPWISESSPGKQLALSVGCTAVGLVLAVGFRDFSGPGFTDSKAGFLLGLLLLGIGVAGIVMHGRQSTVVDPTARLIRVEDRTLFGAKRRVIPFAEVERVELGYLGKKLHGVNFYFLTLVLRGGERYSLFPPGRFYEGASDRSTVEGWRWRLERLLWP